MNAIAKEEAGFASSHAAALLRTLQLSPRPGDACEHPALSWARSGLMDVTGCADGPALMAPAPLTGAADGALMALKAISLSEALNDITGAQLLGERARPRGRAVLRAPQARRCDVHG